MAIAVLESANRVQIQQKPVHDLESIFYVLLYFCLKFKGPGNLQRLPEDIPEDISMPIDSWFKHQIRFRDLGEKKRTQLDSFHIRFADRFSPYFQDLRQCMVDLFNILFPLVAFKQREGHIRMFKNCRATHDAMLLILRNTYKDLPIIDYENGSGGHADPASKKRLHIDDDGDGDADSFSRRKKHVINKNHQLLMVDSGFHSLVGSNLFNSPEP